MAITILHLSDVHLGDDWIPRAIITRRPWWKFVHKKITDGLIEAIRESKADYIVLSGALTNPATGHLKELPSICVRFSPRPDSISRANCW